MKKMFKTAAVLAALLAMTNFIACSSGDDDNSEPSSGTESSTTGGDSSSSDSGSSSGSGSESSGTDSGSSGDSSSTGGDSSTTTTYANTYWVQEDDVDEDEGTTTTTKAYSYIFLTSETEGSYYYATFPSGTVTTTTVEGTYSAAESFTYAVSGTTITGTLNESAITGTIASDGSSITLNMPVSATETTAIKFNKASAAPEKPVITITTSGSSATKINLTQNITALAFDTTTAGLTDTAEATKNGLYMIRASTTILDVLAPTKDNKAFWYTDKNRSKISALQLNSEGELKFTLSGSATVKIKFLSTGDSNTSAITVNGEQKSVTGKTATEYTWAITAGGDYSISSTGTSNARITAISIVED